MDSDICFLCAPEVSLHECKVQAHWETRLKAYNLGAADPRIQIEIKGEKGERIRIERLLPLAGKHSDMSGAYVPEGLLTSELEDSFRLETNPQARAQFTARTRTKDTTYADINIFERCASPRYRKTA